MNEYIAMKPPLIMRLCCFSLSYVLKNYNNYSKGLVDIIGSQVTYTETHRKGWKLHIKQRLLHAFLYEFMHVAEE